MSRRQNKGKPEKKKGILEDRFLFWGGLVIVLTVLVFHIFSFNFNHPIDDAYISFRYAKNLIKGQGLVYNPGELVEGYTNPLWVLLLAPFIGLGFDPGRISQVLGGAFACATSIIVFII